MIRENARLLIIYELISSPRSCLWNSQVRYRYCRHVGDAAWTYHEVHHSRCHGGYYCHLRVGRGGTYCWFPWGTSHLPLVQVNSFFIFIFFTAKSDKQAYDSQNGTRLPQLIDTYNIRSCGHHTHHKNTTLIESNNI